MKPFLQRSDFRRNVRFWVYWRGSYVRLKLKLGQSLTAGFTERTDEGYHYESSTWGYDGENLMEHWINGGRDCDGPIERSGSLICPLSKINAIANVLAYDNPKDLRCFHAGVEIRRPDWQEESPTRVRDAYAEAMNY